MIFRSDLPRGQKPLPDIGPYFGLRIADFGFFCIFSIWILRSAIRNFEAGPPGVTEFGIPGFFFHSAFSISHFDFPRNPENECGLMVFARNPAKGGTSGPGNA